jgi:hypothetical protein
MTFVVIILVTAVTGLSQAMDVALQRNRGGYRRPFDDDGVCRHRRLWPSGQAFHQR